MCIANRLQGRWGRLCWNEDARRVERAKVLIRVGGWSSRRQSDQYASGRTRKEVRGEGKGVRRAQRTRLIRPWIRQLSTYLARTQPRHIFNKYFACQRHNSTQPFMHFRIVLAQLCYKPRHRRQSERVKWAYAPRSYHSFPFLPPFAGVYPSFPVKRF